VEGSNKLGVDVLFLVNIWNTQALRKTQVRFFVSLKFQEDLASNKEVFNNSVEFRCLFDLFAVVVLSDFYSVLLAWSWFRRSLR